MPTLPITSRQNPRIKEAAALRNRRSRSETGQTLVYGVRESQRAAAAGAELLQLFFCPAMLSDPEASRWIEGLSASGLECWELAPTVYDRLRYGDREDGVIAVAATPRRTLADLLLPERPLIAVIEGVEKPGNLGALLRSADGAGVDAVVVADPVIDLFNPNAIRASVAAVFNANVVVAPAANTLAWLREQRLAMWAARPDANRWYYDVDYRSGGAIVLGGEAAGLTDAWLGADITPIALPMRGHADSLNVSATAAVLFYEAQRQRK